MKTYGRRRSAGGGCGLSGSGSGLPATVVSLDEVCRLCLAREDRLRLVPIFGQDQPLPLSLRIMACVALEVVEDDGLPGMICRPCNYQLEKYCIFRKKCENSDLKLRMHLKQLTESSGIIMGGNVSDDDEGRLDQTVNEHAIVGASITIAIPEEGEGDIELDGQMHEIEEVNDITLPQNELDDTRQACTLKKELDLMDDKDIVHLPLDDKEEDFHMHEKDENNQKLVAMVHSLMPPDEGEVDTEMTESQIVQNESEALSVRVFPSTEGALTHVEVTTGDGSVLLMELTTEEPEPERNDEGELLLFKCDHCPKSFSRPAELRRHSSLHTSQKGYTCNYCDKWFPSQSSYTRHERIHTGEKPYQCGVCQRCFGQKEVLLRHMLVHSGLSRHVLTHTGRTYLCNECQKIFNDKSSLRRHIRVSGHQE
ncbi:uncharacterized protein LOC143919725 isoform X2 [Arctopsyche grandis]|uniref:uncharacterized protein LOC143919725 isoform X2 n=1 Tax=Arctopsyche grandis TaxID=121162 RepID=UPI00406D955F